VAYIPAIKGDIQLQGGNIRIYSSRGVYLIVGYEVVEERDGDPSAPWTLGDINKEEA
jgi:hypothetical protein